MINPVAVAEFLDRKRANSDKAKRFSDAALDRMLARLDPKPRFVLPPYRHQKIAFLLGLKYGSYLYLLDMGAGKSKLTLDLFRYRRRIGKSKRLLVLVPGTANIGRKEEDGGGWGEEVYTHAPSLEFLGIDETLGGEARREAILHTKADIVVITYQGWLQLISTPVKVRTRRKQSIEELMGGDAGVEWDEKTAWQIDKKKAKALERLFDEVAFDESDAIQNRSSLYFRSARRLMKTARYRLCLTGTPFDKDPTSMWAQFFVVDHGASIGAHLGLFRAAFFHEKRNFWSGGFEYEFDQRMKEDLYRAMRHRSVRFSEEECLDLPKSIGGLKHPIIRSVLMPRETWQHYKNLVEELKAARGNYQLVEQAYMRMRMLCSGYLPMRDEESGKRIDVALPQNPKMDALVGLLREIPAEKKVIVFCVYRTTGALIAERLKKERIKHVRLFGGTSDKIGAVAQFKKDAKTRVLLASASGARGHNLQYVCHHSIFFESPDSLRQRAQMEKRTRRSGQEHRPHFYDLHVAASIDQRILDSLRSGKRLFDALVDGTGTLDVPPLTASPRARKGAA